MTNNELTYISKVFHIFYHFPKTSDQWLYLTLITLFSLVDSPFDILVTCLLPYISNLLASVSLGVYLRSSEGKDKNRCNHHLYSNNGNLCIGSDLLQ